MTLEDDQSDEVIDIIKRIEQDCSDELQSVFEEADGHSSLTGKYLLALWEHDKVKCKDKT